MLWPTNTRGSFPLLLGSTNYITPLTGIVSTTNGTLIYKNAQRPGTWQAKSVTVGSWKELSQGMYTIAFSPTEIGSIPGFFLYSFYTKKGLPYFGLLRLQRHDLDFLGTMQGSINARKLSTTGTFSYANIALIPGLGTHLQSRITGSIKQATTGTFSYANVALIPGLGTHLQSRIPGTPKQFNTGTFNYSLIAQIGTHLTVLAGSIRQIQGSVNLVKLRTAGTFSYANVALIPNLGTHLQSRIPGTVGLATTLAQIGTHLNARIPGTPKQSITGTFSYANIALIPNLGTHLQSRIVGSVKRDITGTFSYANVALIPGLGTHLQSRITGSVGLATTLNQLGTHLNVRMPGTPKQSTTGTFSYANITLIPNLGTHLQSRIPGSVKRDIAGTFSYSLIAQIGTHLNARIAGSVKLNNAGTFNYANIALIPGLGTHLQSRIPGSVGLATTLAQLGTHLNVRIPGTPKQATTGTFLYANIALIPGLGTHLQSRIPGTAKQSITGTFSYANINVIPNLGTHLQSRVTGTIADANALGTHLNSRITGTVKRSNAGTFSYSFTGSSPSYIGSAVWSKNPNNFIAADTFGQRIGKILERASSGVGGVAVASQVFNEKEKKLLFDWIKVMLDRMMTIEVTVGQLNPETKKIISEVFVNIKTNQTKLEEALQQFLKLDAKQKEGIKNDINFIAASFEEIAKLDSNVKMIRDNLARMDKELQFSIKELPVGKLSSTITLQSQELKTLLNQSINVANDVSARLTRNLTVLGEDRKSLTLTEKAILKLLPTEKLKDILDTDE